MKIKLSAERRTRLAGRLQTLFKKEFDETLSEFRASEIVDLDYIEQAQLMGEIAHASRILKATVGCDKINVAALGNVVPQLHVHVIARSRGDAAWPRPVWNAVPAQAYDPAALQRRLDSLRQRLSLSPL